MAFLMYAETSTPSLAAATRTKLYKSSSKVDETVFSNLSGTTCPPLTEQLSLFQQSGHESDKRVEVAHIHPTARLRYV